MVMQTILSTVHGSHLYGLARPDSDHDSYRVVIGENKTYARQRLQGDDDRLGIHLSRFLESVDKGVPQALEALFSPVAELDPEWAPFLRGLRPGIINARTTYRRTILNFGLGNGGRTGAAAQRTDPVKLRRHALRLCLNLDELVSTGRFNPRLTPGQARAVKAGAQLERTDFEDLLVRALGQAQIGKLHQEAMER